MAKNRSSLDEGCPPQCGVEGALYAISSELDRELDKLMDVFCAGKTTVVQVHLCVKVAKVLFFLV
jgi:hypothetical protein